jgi:hypothetical protein
MYPGQGARLRGWLQGAEFGKCMQMPPTFNGHALERDEANNQSAWYAALNLSVCVRRHCLGAKVV